MCVSWLSEIRCYFCKALNLSCLGFAVCCYVQDFGYPQTTSTEGLKSFVFNEPVVIDAARIPSLGPTAMFVVSFFSKSLVDGS